VVEGRNFGIEGRQDGPRGWFTAHIAVNAPRDTARAGLFASLPSRSFVPDNEAL
jgi:hypothetical protein